MRRLLACLAACLALAACTPPPPADQRAVADLTMGLRALGPQVDPEEAARAAAIAFDYTHQLAVAYEITDPPLVHNTKVNMGLRPRGLCWHWAEDMQARLNAEGFRTLVVHRAIANADNPFRIDHSTAVLSAVGATMEQGIVIDPWRKGGRLTWAPVAEDTDYNWLRQTAAHDLIRARALARGEVLPAHPGG